MKTFFEILCRSIVIADKISYSMPKSVATKPVPHTAKYSVRRPSSTNLAVYTKCLKQILQATIEINLYFESRAMCYKIGRFVAESRRVLTIDQTNQNCFLPTNLTEFDVFSTVHHGIEFISLTNFHAQFFIH